MKANNTAIKITKKDFNGTLVTERSAQIACCNGKVNRVNDIVAILNDTEKMQVVKDNAEWRTVTKTRANGVAFSNGSTLDYKAHAEYYRVGNVIIVVNVDEIEDFDANYNRVNVPYYNVMAYLIDVPETNTDNTMKVNSTSSITVTRYDWLNVMNAKQVRQAAAKYIPAKHFDEYFTAESAPVEVLRSMLEDVIFEYDLTMEDFSDNIDTMNTENTPATMNEANIIEFSDLSHAATNIVLTAKNDGEIYRRHVEPLISSLSKKLAKGVTLNAATLVTSGAMAVIIREAIKVMKSGGWGDPVTAADRKDAATYLAADYISDAEEEYNYTTKA